MAEKVRDMQSTRNEAAAKVAEITEEIRANDEMATRDVDHQWVALEVRNIGKMGNRKVGKKVCF